MTDTIPPIVSAEKDADRRQGERRKDWHTPETCFKLLDVQTTMDRIFARLKDGDARMDSIFSQLEDTQTTIGCMQDNIAGNHRVVSDDIKALETAIGEHRKALDENTAKTDRIFEIVEMGEGFFKGVKATGKWVRRLIMWVVPPITAVVTLWYTLTNHK